MLSAVFMLTACESSDEAASTAALEPNEINDTIKPEEINDEPGTDTTVEEVPDETGGEEEAGASSENNGNPALNLARALTESMAADEDTGGNDGSRVVFLVLESETGCSAREQEILTTSLAGAGYGVTIRYHHNDEEAEKAAFNEAVASQARGIVCDNLPGDVTQEATRTAAEAGVAVFLLNEGIELSGVAQAQIVTDRTGCINELAEKLRDNDPAIRFISLEGVESDSRSIDAMRLLKNALKKQDGLCYDAVTLTSYDDTESTVRDLFSKYPDTNMILCVNTLQTEICLRVLEDLGRQDVRLVCFNGDRDSIEVLIDNGSVEAAIVKPAEKIGSLAADALVRYFKNGTSAVNERQYVKGEIRVVQDAEKE